MQSSLKCCSCHLKNKNKKREKTLQAACLRRGEDKPLQLSPGWHFYCFLFCLFVFGFANCQQRLHMSAELKFWEKQRGGKKVEKKIAGSYVTASWELAGVQESCSINLRKLGQPCTRLRRVCSAPCWQRQERPPGVSWLHPCLPGTGNREGLSEAGWQS